jgi:ubiquinone/menaquinone biosynthesis C-methylase UbiE
MPDHFSQVSDRYAAFRPHYPAALLRLLVEHARAHGLVWDVGCGSGQLSVALAEHFAQVVATDLAQKQLDAAPPHPRITYRCAPAEISGLADASADLVVAAQAAHWFDYPAWLAETERVAKPGAVVAIVSYGRCYFEGDEGVTQFHRVTLDAYWPPGREHVDNGYRDLQLPWTPIAAPAIDMVAEWSRDELVGYLSSWSAVAKLVEREGPAKFDAVRAELTARWPDGQRRKIRWPLAIRIARR